MQTVFFECNPQGFFYWGEWEGVLSPLSAELRVFLIALSRYGRLNIVPPKMKNDILKTTNKIYLTLLDVIHVTSI